MEVRTVELGNQTKAKRWLNKDKMKVSMLVRHRFTGEGQPVGSEIF